MKSLNKYFHTFKISLANNLVYVANLITRNFFFVFIIFIMLMLWKNIYGQKGDMIAGFTLNQMIWYLIVTEMVTLSRSNVFLDVSEDVKKGNIAYLINKPYNYVFYCFSNGLGEIATKLLTNMLIGVVIGFIYVGPLSDFNFRHLPFVLISLILGVFINFFIYMSLALSAFWMEENTAFMWIYSKLIFTLGGMLIPLEMFPGWLEGLAKNLPFAYVTYGPAKLAVSFNYSNFIHTIAYQLGYLLIFILLSMAVFRRGGRALNVNGG
ncbi:ABC transporter permease [Alkaliphilus serpentinus]|uniref:ABC-2 type transport system permease protein n=1 Tax=Alkaliphilus serpentinus TaxID=1482731 RepID=A0A833HMZ9_9FIRM|nr:ABC-2 family transporter protein [Alkaliphilus serpentinus]KAB3529145.1 hypothetical protein F8153_09905 [Alkaliphilus serpentinus]